MNYIPPVKYLLERLVEAGIPVNDHQDETATCEGKVGINDVIHVSVSKGNFVLHRRENDKIASSAKTRDVNQVIKTLRNLLAEKKSEKMANKGPNIHATAIRTG